MVVRRQKNARLNPSLGIDQYNFGRVEQFKYLEMILTENNNTAQEIEARIQAGNKCFFRLAKLLELDTVKRLKKTIIHYLDRINCYIWSRDLDNLKIRQE